ncbi:MAG: hypothetical protein H7837_13775, partial [Magnetococcus sp. MYC-9]
MTIGISEAYGFVGYAPGGYFLADANPAVDGPDADTDPANDWVVNPDAVGLSINDVTAGFVMLEAEGLVDSAQYGTMMAGKIDVGSAGFMGLDALEISARGVSAYVNLPGSYLGAGDAVVDFA